MGHAPGRRTDAPAIDEPLGEHAYDAGVKAARKRRPQPHVVRRRESDPNDPLDGEESDFDERVANLRASRLKENS